MRKFIISLLFFMASCGFTPHAMAQYSQPITATASYYKTGRITANGERFNPNGFTCAHRYLRFNTRILVRYGNRSVECRINDRGPFVRGRTLDLSYGAARQLGILDQGIARVTYTVL